MAGSANALQAAIFARLSGDSAIEALVGPGAIFDHRQTGRAMPHLVISELLTSDFGPGCEEHRLTLEVWSDAAGRRQAQEIAARVKALFDAADLSLDGFVLVNLTHQSTRTRREAKSKALVAEIQFRAVTE